MSTDLPQSIITSRGANLKFILMLIDLLFVSLWRGKGAFSNLPFACILLVQAFSNK